jgi:hypothetical protein
MDKPKSMSVKDFLIRTLAVKLLKSEKTIEAIVNHQFQSANEAMDLNNSVEISGFGKFVFNNKKGQLRLVKLDNTIKLLQRIIDNPDVSEQKKNSANVSLEKVVLAVEHLKSRVTYED